MTESFYHAATFLLTTPLCQQQRPTCRTRCTLLADGGLPSGRYKMGSQRDDLHSPGLVI